MTSEARENSLMSVVARTAAESNQQIDQNHGAVFARNSVLTGDGPPSPFVRLSVVATP